jgi:uncharacterized membrane protein
MPPLTRVPATLAGTYEAGASGIDVHLIARREPPPGGILSTWTKPDTCRRRRPPRRPIAWNCRGRGIRKLATGSVPSLLTISMIVLTVQAVVAVATGNLWIFLVHFPLANLGLFIVFGRTARGHSPLAARLAAEVIGLRYPESHRPRLHPFFQKVTALWAGIFLLLAVSLGVLLATVPLKTYVLVWAVITIVLIAAGVGASVLWFRSVLRRLDIRFRFAPVPTV